MRARVAYNLARLRVGQVWESGGRAIDGAGKPVAPGAELERLYLNPGAADRTAATSLKRSMSCFSVLLLAIRRTYELLSISTR